jgi:hypothetical protein
MSSLSESSEATANNALQPTREARAAERRRLAAMRDIDREMDDVERAMVVENGNNDRASPFLPLVKSSAFWGVALLPLLLVWFALFE